MSGRRSALFAGGAQRLTRPAALPKTERVRGNFSDALWRVFNQFVCIVAFGMSQQGALMKPQNIVIALVLIAGGASLSAVAQWPAISRTAGGARRNRFHGAAPAGQRRTRQPSPVAATRRASDSPPSSNPVRFGHGSAPPALTSPSPSGTLPTPWRASPACPCDRRRRSGSRARSRSSPRRSPPWCRPRRCP